MIESNLRYHKIFVIKQSIECLLVQQQQQQQI